MDFKQRNVFSAKACKIRSIFQFNNTISIIYKLMLLYMMAFTGQVERWIAAEINLHGALITETLNYWVETSLGMLENQQQENAWLFQLQMMLLF